MEKPKTTQLIGCSVTTMCSFFIPSSSLHIHSQAHCTSSPCSLPTRYWQFHVPCTAHSTPPSLALCSLLSQHDSFHIPLSCSHRSKHPLIPHLLPLLNLDPILNTFPVHPFTRSWSFYMFLWLALPYPPFTHYPLLSLVFSHLFVLSPLSYSIFILYSFSPCSCCIFILLLFNL